MEMEELDDMVDQDERMVINTNEFIKEIKENPCIWNYTSDEYSSVSTRVLAWEKIFRKFSDNYDEMDQSAKEQISRKLQRKWKTLRDGFSRYLSQRRKCNNKSRASRPYTYFHQLSFLMKPKKGTLEPMKMKHMRGFTTHPRGRPKYTAEEKKRKEVDHAPIKIEPQEDIEDVLTAPLARAADPLENSIIQTPVQIATTPQPQTSTVDFDEDKFFLLSLYKDFKKIPDEIKLHAKGEIIEVLKKYTMNTVQGGDF